jgi:pSer/pThr/pTyr-binding forkhead associated (FHA) protein
MGIRLTVKMKGAAAAADATRTVMLDDPEILFGRDDTCQVVLAQMAVSRTHARISKDDTLFFLEDLGSSYGTRVNDQKLPKGQKRLLRNGDVIQIAQFDITFDRVAEVSSEASGKTQFVSRNLIKDVMKGISAGGDNAWFRVMNGPREGTKIELAEGQEYVFGRDEDGADIVLNDDLVSRRHAKARRDWSGTHVEDLGSRNGIKVNGKKATRATLKDRDEVEIGGVRLLFIDPTEVREEAVVVSAAALEPEDDDEHTEAIRAPAVEAALARAAEPEVAAAPPEPEPAPDPAPESLLDAPPVSMSDAEPVGSNAALPALPSLTQSDPVDDAPRALIDLKNPQTLIFLGLGAVVLLVGVVMFVILVAGG